MSRQGVVQLAAVVLLAVAGSAHVPAVHADGCRSGVTGAGNVEIALVNNDNACFAPNGVFSLSAPNRHEGGSSRAGRPIDRPVPPGPPITPPEIDLNQLAMELFQTRARGCLTGADTAPCELVAEVPPGAFNVRSTEASIAWLMKQVGDDDVRDMALPGIVIQTNPTIGLAQVESWFWVDRTTYNGQPYSQTAQILAPWTLDWDYLVHHHDAVHGPCPGNPGQSCVVGFHDWDETLHGHQDHLDVATATVTLTPAQFAWDFGDDADGPPRADSHMVLPGMAGMGIPYVDPSTPSPVAHKYRESSRLFFDQGGFDVHLQAHWSSHAVVTVTRDGVLIQSETRDLGERVGDYDTLVQVRESQPVTVASP